MRQFSCRLLADSASSVSTKALSTSRYSYSPSTTGAAAAEEAATFTVASQTLGGKQRPASAQPCHLSLSAMVSPAFAPESGAVTLKVSRNTSCSPKYSSLWTSPFGYTDSPTVTPGVAAERPSRFL